MCKIFKPYIFIVLELFVGLKLSAAVPQATLDAARGGNAEAQCDAGLQYYAEGDYDNAVKWFRKSAQGGNASAIYNLGICYEKGQGVQQDILEAVINYRKAAEASLPEAQYMLAGCYKDGIGMQRNEEKAKTWYKQASDQGYPLAQYEYAINYLGKYTAEYKTLLEKAYESGIIKAAYPYALCFLEGIDQDDIYGLALLKKAIENGDGKAMVYMGKLYYDGKFVSEDKSKAFELFSQAAKRGNADGIYWKAVCLEKGHGTAADPTMAYILYEQIADRHNEAKKIIDERRSAQEFNDYQAKIVKTIYENCTIISSGDKDVSYNYNGSSKKTKAKISTGYSMTRPITYQDYYAVVLNKQYDNTGIASLTSEEAQLFSEKLNELWKKYSIGNFRSYVPSIGQLVLAHKDFPKIVNEYKDYVYSTGIVSIYTTSAGYGDSVFKKILKEKTTRVREVSNKQGVLILCISECQ